MIKLWARAQSGVCDSTGIKLWARARWSLSRLGGLYQDWVVFIKTGWSLSRLGGLYQDWVVFIKTTASI